MKQDELPLKRFEITPSLISKNFKWLMLIKKKIQPFKDFIHSN